MRLIGSIKVGKLADLVILERNIMGLESPEELLGRQGPRHRDGRRIQVSG